ncbi:uncharacterized protein LOC113352116 [Papaver somniferum]|uniref:uncharacterized protein LOC113352116 n=1 Tax=Papaver somniferum TaxID=3469 RepID=UPI000E6F8E92|nr:uncharacterized protein LOC113352116 [Papaver somniferum]
MVIIEELEEMEYITNNEDLEVLEFITNNEDLEEIEFITNNEDLKEMEFSMNNEEVEDMDFNMNNEGMEEMEFSMNNEEMEEMDSNSCFPGTVADSVLQTNLEQTTTLATESSISTRNKKELTDEQRLSIFHFLLKDRNKGRLRKGSVPREAQLFSVSESTVKRTWRRGKEYEAKNIPVDMSSRKPTRVGRKAKKVDLIKIMEIPLRQRTKLRSLAEALDMPLSTVHRQVKKGAIRKHMNAIKPAFTVDIKKKRLEFCLEMLETIQNKYTLMVKDMHNVIHIDEKWFFMTKTMENYYLHPEETEPHRTCQSKRYIKKVMFLATVSRPRFDEFGNEIFDGKLGIFPFIAKEAAKRTSKNRPAGTLEDKTHYS